MPGHARPKTSPGGTRRILSLFVVRVPFLSHSLPRHPACPFSRSQRGPRALPPFSLALSPRNSARLAGVMPARSSACMQARCTVLSGGWRDEQWLLCIHVPSSSLLLVVPRNDQDLPMIFNAGSATRAAEFAARRSCLTRLARDHGPKCILCSH